MTAERPKERTARAIFVLAPALVAGIVAAVGLGLLGPSERPGAAPPGPVESASPAEKAELRSPPLRTTVAFAPGERPERVRPRPSSGRRPAVPARLAIPAADVRATVSGVGATRRGVEIPQPGRTGWYRLGPRPGEPGRAVIVGHVDNERGPAVFARLRSLRRGEAIEVRDQRGRVYRYRVVTKERVAKTRFPREDVFGSTARRVLVLVTCGGPFKRGRGYRDNVIVYARAS